MRMDIYTEHNLILAQITELFGYDPNMFVVFPQTNENEIIGWNVRQIMKDENGHLISVGRNPLGGKPLLEYSPKTLKDFKRFREFEND